LQTYGRNVSRVESEAEAGVTMVDGVDVLIDKLDDSAAVELVRPRPPLLELPLLDVK
jgi:hypothetical protein